MRSLAEGRAKGSDEVRLRDIRDLGKGQAFGSAGYTAASVQLYTTPVALFNCPTRRAAKVFHLVRAGLIAIRPRENEC